MVNSRTIGIIGAGTMVSENHLPVLKAMGMDIRWVMDVDRSRAAAVASAFKIPAVLGQQELESADCTDLVLVACPYGVRNPYYELMTAWPAALYIEKPLARSLTEFEHICALRPDHALAAGFYRRSLGGVRIVKAIFDDALLGKLHRVRCEFGAATVISSGGGFAKSVELAGGGQLFESAIHSVDAVCYITGATHGLLRKCRMESDGGFDLHTAALLELVDAAGHKIEFELLVTCFRSTKNQIELEFDNGNVTFSLFKSTPPQVRGTKRSYTYEIVNSVLGHRPYETYETLYSFWNDFLLGLQARTANYTAARNSAVTTSLIEKIYAAGRAERVSVPATIDTALA